MDVEEILKWLAVASVCASAITAATPTPKDDGVLKKIYSLIEAMGLVVGKAKQ